MQSHPFVALKASHGVARQRPTHADRGRCTAGIFQNIQGISATLRVRAIAVLIAGHGPTLRIAVLGATRAVCGAVIRGHAASPPITAALRRITVRHITAATRMPILGIGTK